MNKSDDSERVSRTLPSRNIRAIARLENEALHQRSLTGRISDGVTRFAGSSVFIVLHIIWFSLWIILNMGRVRGIHPFDPYPFTFLTMVVSLEAIFLSIFVLISQNRMAHQADRRAHLDLQINLLAEQENTLMLRMRRQASGRIVNIVSIGGKIGVPHLLPYTMSKFALSGLSQGLRSEIARDGILLTAIYPGLMYAARRTASLSIVNPR